jgi:hypothetical protein
MTEDLARFNGLSVSGAMVTEPIFTISFTGVDENQQPAPGTRTDINAGLTGVIGPTGAVGPTGVEGETGARPGDDDHYGQMVVYPEASNVSSNWYFRTTVGASSYGYFQPIEQPTKTWVYDPVTGMTKEVDLLRNLEPTTPEQKIALLEDALREQESRLVAIKEAMVEAFHELGKHIGCDSQVLKALQRLEDTLTKPRRVIKADPDPSLERFGKLED